MAKFAAKDSNKNITLSPHGTGKVVVGTGSADATVQSDGNHNLVLQTGNSTTGSISITDGANGDIAISPNGTGTVVVNTDLDVDNINVNGNAITSTNTDGNIDLTPNGTGEVNISKVDIDSGAVDGITLGTNSVVTEAQIDNININGNAITSTDTNGNIALTPNGTGEVDISKVDIDSGTIDGATIATSDVTVGSGKTLNVSAGTLTTSTAQKQAIVDGADIEGTAILSTGESGGSKFLREDGDNSCSWQTVEAIPSGMIAPFAMASAPSGWLVCDGSTNVSKTTYADLYNALTANDTISNPWGSGDDSNTFAIPDLKGAYLRGAGVSTVFTENSTITLAQTLSDQLQTHTHTLQFYNLGSSLDNLRAAAPDSSSGLQTKSSMVIGTGGRSGNETRPNTRGVQYMIKI